MTISVMKKISTTSLSRWREDNPRPNMSPNTKTQWTSRQFSWSVSTRTYSTFKTNKTSNSTSHWMSLLGRWLRSSHQRYWVLTRTQRLQTMRRFFKNKLRAWSSTMLCLLECSIRRIEGYLLCSSVMQWYKIWSTSLKILRSIIVRKWMSWKLSPICPGDLTRKEKSVQVMFMEMRDHHT